MYASSNSLASRDKAQLLMPLNHLMRELEGSFMHEISPSFYKMNEA